MGLSVLYVMINRRWINLAGKQVSHVSWVQLNEPPPQKESENKSTESARARWNAVSKSKHLRQVTDS